MSQGLDHGTLAGHCIRQANAFNRHPHAVLDKLAAATGMGCADKREIELLIYKLADQTNWTAADLLPRG